MLSLRTLCVSAVLVSAAAAVTLRPAPTQEAPMPTKEHALLMEAVGEWEGTLTSMMPGMEGDMPATETITAFGPFWTQSSFSCEFPGLPMAYEGTGVMGYDEKTQEHVGTWIHNTDPHISVMRGKKDEKTGEITMHWEAPNPMTGEMTPHHSVSTQTKDMYETKFYMSLGETHMHQMTISMKRKKD